LYWELRKDPAALKALRRVTDFHKYFTNPDGSPVEVIDDRNRNRTVSAWGSTLLFEFRRRARIRGVSGELFKPETLTIDQLGRLAQDALITTTARNRRRRRSPDTSTRWKSGGDSQDGPGWWSFPGS
jgi:hypothetical protein